MSDQEDVVRLATAAGLTVATAESLTAGLVSARLADVPGASLVLRGGVVAYASDLKHDLLGVPADLIEQRGAVDPDVAVAMASGVRARLRADLGVATTGVAGPDPQGGLEPGTVFLAVAWPGGARARQLSVDGDRAVVRARSAQEAVALLLSVVTVLSEGR